MSSHYLRSTLWQCWLFDERTSFLIDWFKKINHTLVSYNLRSQNINYETVHSCQNPKMSYRLFKTMQLCVTDIPSPCHVVMLAHWCNKTFAYHAKKKEVGSTQPPTWSHHWRSGTSQVTQSQNLKSQYRQG